MAKVDKIYTQTTHEKGDFLNQTHVSYGPSILLIVFVALVLIMYFQVVFGVGQGLSFTGFLNTLSRAPSIDISWMSKLTSFKVDLPVIGALVKFITGTISVMVYLSVGVAQLVVYVGYILGFLVGAV